MLLQPQLPDPGAVLLLCSLRQTRQEERHQGGRQTLWRENICLQVEGAHFGFFCCCWRLFQMKMKKRHRNSAPEWGAYCNLGDLGQSRPPLVFFAAFCASFRVILSFPSWFSSGVYCIDRRFSYHVEPHYRGQCVTSDLSRHSNTSLNQSASPAFQTSETRNCVKMSVFNLS